MFSLSAVLGFSRLFILQFDYPRLSKWSKTLFRLYLRMRRIRWNVNSATGMFNGWTVLASTFIDYLLFFVATHSQWEWELARLSLTFDFLGLPNFNEEYVIPSTTCRCFTTKDTALIITSNAYSPHAWNSTSHDIHRINRATNQPQTLAHFRNNRSLWFPFPWVLSARPHHIGSDLLLLHRTLYFEHTLVARRTLGAYVDMKMLRLPSPTPNSLLMLRRAS